MQNNKRNKYYEIMFDNLLTSVILSHKFLLPTGSLRRVIQVGSYWDYTVIQPPNNPNTQKTFMSIAKQRENTRCSQVIVV